MSNIHEGVSCDICMKSNFTGKRYKCLICYDFDLCETCHEKFTLAKNSASVTAGTISSTTAPKMTNTNHNHQETHPMQCILTRNDYELYYGTGGGGAAAAAGVLIDYGEQLSFTCPYCGRLGFSESALCEHLSQFHLGGTQAEQQNLSQEVVCPICAVLPSSSGGDPNHLTDDLLHHIQLEHMNSPSDPLTLNSGLIGSSSGAAARFSRRLNYAAAAAAAANLSRSSNSTGTSNLLLSSGASAATTVARNHLSGSTSNRFGFQLSGAGAGIGQPGTSAGLSSFIRSATTAMETLGSGSSSSGVNSASDPIVELLSQLTGVRRANVQSTNIQLQQLQAQLTRERESLQQQASASSAAALAASAASSAAPLSSSNTSTRHHHYSSATVANASPSQHHHHHHSSHLFPSSGGSNILSNKLLSSSKMSNAASSNAGVNNNQTAGGANGSQNSSVTNLTNALINQILELPNVSFLQQLPSNVRDPRFLLSKYDFSNMESSSQPTSLPSVSGNASSSALPPPPPTTMSNNSKSSSLNIISQSIFVNELLLALIVGNERINDPQNSAPIQASAVEASTAGESSNRKKQIVPSLTSASSESMTATLLFQESTSASTRTATETQANQSNLVVAENEQILEELLREQCVVTANNSQQQQQSATNI